MGIQTTPVFDNNACHTPGPGVPAGQLCAMTLENTAWYTFVVENDGSCIITIDSIACDNGNGNNVNGFQIGFFGGTCSGLTPLTCFSGTGGMIQGTVSSLTAGSRIYVGVDGYSGSNCRYRIRATNAVVLPLHFRSFFAGAAGNDNLLVWDMDTGDSTIRYEIQRSVDGQHFDLAGLISATTNLSPGQRQTFRDIRPPLRCYYRIKAMDLRGRESFSPVREVRRPGQVTLDQLTVMPGSLTFRLTSFKATRCSAFLTDRSGLLMHRSAFYCEQGSRNYRIPLSGIVSAGPFFLHLRYPDGSQISRQVFIPAY
jgi:hypothetical protein